MDKEILKNRLKMFAIDIAKILLKLPYNVLNKNYSNQLVRSSSSAAANYRAACRAKSTPDFINKLKIVEEELDESLFFIELLIEFNIEFVVTLQSLHRESNELLSIIVAALNTLRRNQQVENRK